MAAHEDQLELIVSEVVHVGIVHEVGRIERHAAADLRTRSPPGELLLLATTNLTPQEIDAAAAGHREEPRRRVPRQSLDRPSGDRDRDRFLQRLLGEVEIPNRAHERAEQLARVLAVQLLDPAVAHAPGISMTGRTSTVPKPASGICAANSMARSRSGTSTR